MRKIGANGWYKELEKTINPVINLRNPNNELLKERDGKVYKISIGYTSGKEIDEKTQELNNLLNNYEKNIITPCFAPRVFRLLNITMVSWPHGPSQDSDK